MHIVHVFIQVKPGDVEAFKAATLDNARNSVQEEGVARFDVIQQQDDACRFVLVEVYRNADDQLRHRETAHYLRWREAAGSMMAQERHAIKYTNVFPDDAGWE